jgi:hypothetical protein
MKIYPKSEGTYEVESKSSGKFWKVDLSKNLCNCPHFLFRLRKFGGECKHIKAVKELVTKGNADKFDEIKSYVTEHVFVDSIEIIEKFGEDIVNEMIAHGELIEEHGKIRLL